MADVETIETELRARAQDRCELCGAQDDLRAQEVPPAGDATADRCVLVCGVCAAQLGEGADLDEKHWFCLKESAWAPTPAVQVIAVRLLRRLETAPWAQDLLGQLYLDDETQAWANAAGGDPGAADDDVATLDSNGARLADGDSVTLIQDLDVKGAGFVAKRGTLVKNIKLTGDPAHIEGKVNKTTLVLKTKFLKKA